MSFSSRAKGGALPRAHKAALLRRSGGLRRAALLRVFSTREIRIVTANDDFAERLPRLFRRAFSLDFDERPAEGARGKRRFLISDAGKIAAVYRAFGMEAAETLTLHINLGVLENECCRASFVRGAFLARGQRDRPGEELSPRARHDARQRQPRARSVLLELGFEPGQAMRGANYVTYMKQSEAIADFLTAVGAPVAALDVMSAKVERDMRNEINRKVNCDTANADKTVAAAQEQLAAIRAVEQEYGLDGLPEGLQQAALLRIANPEASLADLAMLSSPAVTKSCLSHRLKRLVELGRGIGKGD